jgi:hypothetical protein
MSEEELEAAKASGKEVDEFGFQDEKDEENNFVAVLFRDAIGHFRVIEHSGFNSIFSGAGNIGDRLSPEEVDKWTTTFKP